MRLKKKIEKSVKKRCRKLKRRNRLRRLPESDRNSRAAMQMKSFWYDLQICTESTLVAELALRNNESLPVTAP